MRVLLVPNTGNAEAVAAALDLGRWVVSQGGVPVMAGADAEASDALKWGVSASEIGEPDLVVALGGDGTILKAVHLIGEIDVPVLGIKYGRLGFLSGARPESAAESVTAALQGKARIERRTTLAADVYMDGRVVGTHRALNEVVISRGHSARVVSFSLAVDGHHLASVRADGVIVSTATGSTAYALSAGGPVVAPGYRGMVVVPVAPHSLCMRPLVTGPEESVEIGLPDPARADACFVVDGEVTPCRRAIERVVVRAGERDVSLVKLDGRHFYETVADEFFGG